MLPPLEDWELGDVEAVAAGDFPEGVELEKKAADKLDASGGKLSADHRDELAKQACAFANAGGGFIVYGVRDASAGGGLDNGILPTVGRQPVKEWAEGFLSTALTPGLLECLARFIPYPNVPEGRGALVVWVSSSDRRPHWLRVGGREVAYIRAGARSEPMSLQTFLDVHSRGGSPQIEILDAAEWRRQTMNDPNLQNRRALFTPMIRLVAGEICRDWLVELSLSAAGDFGLPGLGTGPADSNFTIPKRGTIAITGRQPLYPHRATPIDSRTIEMTTEAPVTKASPQELTVVVYAGGARPVSRSFAIAHLLAL